MLRYLRQKSISRVKVVVDQFPRKFFADLVEELELYEKSLYISRKLYRDMVWVLHELPLTPELKIEGLAIVKSYETVHYFKRADIVRAIYLTADKAKNEYSIYLWRVSKII
nr:hypothetical protein K-LCC10_0049 [Kaumoebavirus]